MVFSFNTYYISTENFSVIFWSEHVFRVENVKSEIRIRIVKLFKENNITIPFPQSVIHFDKEVEKE